jgi:aquaporin Z
MKKLPWGVFVSELVGTGVLILVGLSFVILDFGNGSPIVRLLPDPGLRRLITGFLFGSTGALIAVSKVGKVSGAHINPVVTLAFWLRGKLDGKIALGYVLAQLIGAILGTIPLIIWGQMGESVSYGATLPGQAYGPVWAVAGELVTTFALIVGLFLFLGHSGLRNFTPLLFPFLYAIMVFLEAPVSGTSTNPARSLGPALVSGEWQYWWVYWLGPLLGTFLALSLQRVPWFRRFEIEVAKVYHFGHDPLGIFGLEKEIEQDFHELEERL